MWLAVPGGHLHNAITAIPNFKGFLSTPVLAYPIVDLYILTLAHLAIGLIS